MWEPPLAQLVAERGTMRVGATIHGDGRLMKYSLDMLARNIKGAGLSRLVHELHFYTVPLTNGQGRESWLEITDPLQLIWLRARLNEILGNE